MGGDSNSTPPRDDDDEYDFQHKSFLSSDEEGPITKSPNGLDFGGLSEQRPPQSSAARENQRCKLYAQVLRTYDDLQSRLQMLDQAKDKLLSYTPGSWVEMGGGLGWGTYDVPKITSLLLIGPKGSGKSSLVNKISRVFEDGVFASGRAQVSHNPSTEDGTCFVQRHLIPRGSGSFCLYDTRSLADNSRENMKMLKPWMTKGIRHGELVKRKSDTKDFKARLRYKARRGSSFGEVTSVDYVIFVVNGLSVLESLNNGNDGKRQYSQKIETAFNNPLLSFKDDKPVVVVTHGDLMSLSDRVKIRIYLGDLLGIPPATQIFDIPASNDPATTLTIVDMLSSCLVRADSNLPARHRFIDKISTPYFLACLFVLVFMLIAILIRCYADVVRPYFSSEIEEDWPNIRHLW